MKLSQTPSLNTEPKLPFATLAVLAVLAGCGEGTSPYEDDSGVDVGVIEANTVPELPCAPKYRENLPIEVLKGDVRVVIGRVLFGGSKNVPYDLDYDLSAGERVDVPFCTNYGTTTFEFAATPEGPIDGDGNRAVMRLGPLYMIDVDVRSPGGEEFFQSGGIDLGFSGPRGVPEEFDVTLSSWQF